MVSILYGTAPREEVIASLARLARGLADVGETSGDVLDFRTGHRAPDSDVGERDGPCPAGTASP